MIQAMKAVECCINKMLTKTQPIYFVDFIMNPLVALIKIRNYILFDEGTK
tara:strand:- start:54 stop:203 length:150 start_codon:yes stop_codon:yes gene_type:complete